MQLHKAAHRSSVASLRLAAVTLAVLAVISFVPANNAYAKTKKHGKTTASAASSKKVTVNNSTRPSPSEETRAERDRRFYRECKGMPNAGACKGFTRQ